MARPGRPLSDKPWKEAIRLAVNRKGADGRAILIRLAESLTQKALDGDVSALRELGDRLDGKAHQSMDVAVSDERMVVNASTPAETAEEWEQKHRPH